MLNVGTGELAVILLLALVILGPERLPDAARKAGHAAAELRQMARGVQTELRSAVDRATDTNGPPT